MKRTAFLALVLLLALPALGAGKPLTPGPPSEIHCLVVVDGANEYRTMLGRPIPISEMGKAFENVGNTMKAAGAVFNDPAMTKRGQAVIEGAKNGDWTAGRVCYVSLDYCAPSCWGNGCGRLVVITPQ